MAQATAKKPRERKECETGASIVIVMRRSKTQPSAHLQRGEKKNKDEGTGDQLKVTQMTSPTRRKKESCMGSHRKRSSAQGTVYREDRGRPKTTSWGKICSEEKVDGYEDYQSLEVQSARKILFAVLDALLSEERGRDKRKQSNRRERSGACPLGITRNSTISLCSMAPQFP